jgi:putative aldouronate transport system permease protein
MDYSIKKHALVKRHENNKKTPVFFHILLIFFSLLFILPFAIIISASLTKDSTLARQGFSLYIPDFDTLAYRYLFANPKIIVNAYNVTIFITLTGTFIGVLVMSMAAFCLSRAHMAIKRVLSFYIYFPALFSGGIVSSYIINTRYLNLKDSIWSMVLPGLINIYYVMMLRTFFRQIPDSIFESAKIDGASEYRIYFTMLLPLSTPVLATVAFLNALNKWNEWYSAMLYISVDRLAPLQYLLQRMMMNLQVLRLAMEKVPMMVDVESIPGENLRMAMLVVSIGPMLMFFPFFQRYFARGMTVGSIKG